MENCPVNSVPSTMDQFDSMMNWGATVNRVPFDDVHESLAKHSEFLNIMQKHGLRSLYFQTLAGSIDYLAQNLEGQNVVSVEP